MKVYVVFNVIKLNSVNQLFVRKKTRKKRRKKVNFYTAILVPHVPPAGRRNIAGPVHLT